MTIEVNAKFTIKLGDKEIELSLTEARELHVHLTDMLGRDKLPQWWFQPNYPAWWYGQPTYDPGTGVKPTCSDHTIVIS